MVIQNARVYGPDHQFRQRDLVIREGRIAEASPMDGEETLDAQGLLALPGLVASRPSRTLRPAGVSWPSAPLP